MLPIFAEIRHVSYTSVGRPQLLSWQPVVGLGVCLLVSYRNIQYCRLFRTLVASYHKTTFSFSSIMSKPSALITLLHLCPSINTSILDAILENDHKLTASQRGRVYHNVPYMGIWARRGRSLVYHNQCVRR